MSRTHQIPSFMYPYRKPQQEYTQILKCPPHLINKLLPHRPPPVGLILGSRLNPGGCAHRRALTLQSPPDPFKSLVHTMGFHPKHPPRNPPTCQNTRKQLIAPRISHHPPNHRPEKGARPLKECQLEGHEIPRRLVREGQPRRLVILGRPR